MKVTVTLKTERRSPSGGDVVKTTTRSVWDRTASHRSHVKIEKMIAAALDGIVPVEEEE